MKVELHLHTSRYSGCSIVSPSDAMAAAIRRGYDAVFITEHDSVWADSELNALREQFPELRIFPGVELSILSDYSQHLLVLGTNDPAYLERADDPATILSMARSAEHLTVLAHPCRWPGGDDMLREGHLPDAVEFQTGNQHDLAAVRAEGLAAAHSLPAVNAGDVHAEEMLGRCWIETHEDFPDAAGLRRLVLAGAYDNRIAE